MQISSVIALAVQGYTFSSGTAAARPAAGTNKRFYFATDTKRWSFDTGSAWLELDAATVAGGLEGVTNGNSHDHNGGDGAQIDHVNLANKGTNTHAQIDTALALARGGYVLFHPILALATIVSGTWQNGAGLGGWGAAHGSLGQNPAAINDEVYWPAASGGVVLPTGTYTMIFIGDTRSDAGIRKIYMDDVLKLTSDGYSAGTGSDVLTSVTGVSLGGAHKVGLKIDSKNASSTSYFAFFTALLFVRTA